MTEYGYFLPCEEHGPAERVEQVRMAERAGFTSLWISDHYHPWNDDQGQSPFVRSAIGTLSQAVSLPVQTAVTCPTVRIHPAVVAQAAATSAVQLGGRFRLGVGRSGGGTKPVAAGRKVCWGTDQDDAVRTAHRLWVNEQLTGELAQILPTPHHFEQASELVTPERVEANVTCGTDPDAHVEAVQEYVDAGFDTVQVNQIGADQRGFFDFCRTEVLPRLRG